MKRKFFSVLVALVLVLSMSLVMAAPVAANVSAATVTVVPTTASTTDAVYTIVFTTTLDLALSATDEVRIEFPTGTTVPAGYDSGDITVNGTNVATASASAQLVTINVPADVPTGTVTVVFTAAANIDNPTTAGSYTLKVSTSKEVTQVTSSSYAITLQVPTVTNVQPNSGNVGDTMWVEVTGTDFTGTAATNVSTTTFNFGAGITVVSTKFVSATEIDAQITINIAGAVSVAATTTAGTGTTTYTFTANAAGTPQVDVWDTYTPSADILADTWDGATLAMSVAVQTTIGAAITAASGGDVLVVHADTYVENLVIGKSITLQSLDGPATTIIDASTLTHADVRGAVQIMLNTVTLGGDGVGFTIIAPDATTGLPNQYGVEIFVDGATSGVTIEGNTIRGSTTTGSDSPQVGIHIWGTGPYTTLTIKDNTLTTTYTVDMTPLWSKSSAGIVTGANVTSLQGAFDGNTITGFSVGMSLDELDVATTTIFDNTVTGCDFNGISVSGTAAIDVYSNTISGCGGNGLAISGVQTDIDVYKNVIYGNGNGVKVYAGTDATNVTLAYNDIYSNTNTTLPAMPVGQEITYENYGVLNADTGSGILTAKYNWWGEIGGPNSATYTTGEAGNWWVGTALGNGDIVAAVSGSSVVYDPWLTRTQATTVSDGIAYHGSTYPLEAGWNTLSVPLALDDGADTFSDIVALGDFFVTSGTAQNYLLGYYYDASLGLWVPLTGTYEFAPCQAVYVKMKADASFPVLYSGVFGLPSVSLPVGWNLVGSAFGIDKGSGEGDGDYGIALPTGGPPPTDTEAYKTVATALASLGANASVVISPPMPGQVAAWATTIGGTTQNMIVGEGYWVFMTAAATLAGFEVTPIYKLFLP